MITPYVVFFVLIISNLTYITCKLDDLNDGKANILRGSKINNYLVSDGNNYIKAGDVGRDLSFVISAQNNKFQSKIHDLNDNLKNNLYLIKHTKDAPKVSNSVARDEKITHIIHDFKKTKDSVGGDVNPAIRDIVGDKMHYIKVPIMIRDIEKHNYGKRDSFPLKELIDKIDMTNKGVSVRDLLADEVKHVIDGEINDLKVSIHDEKVDGKDSIDVIGDTKLPVIIRYLPKLSDNINGDSDIKNGVLIPNEIGQKSDGKRSDKDKLGPKYVNEKDSEIVYTKKRLIRGNERIKPLGLRLPAFGYVGWWVVKAVFYKAVEKGIEKGIDAVMKETAKILN